MAELIIPVYLIGMILSMLYKLIYEHSYNDYYLESISSIEDFQDLLKVLGMGLLSYIGLAWTFAEGVVVPKIKTLLEKQVVFDPGVISLYDMFRDFQETVVYCVVGKNTSFSRGEKQEEFILRSIYTGKNVCFSEDELKLSRFKRLQSIPIDYRPFLGRVHEGVDK